MEVPNTTEASHRSLDGGYFRYRNKIERILQPIVKIMPVEQYRGWWMVGCSS
ncbi:hypothetical protein KIN20_029287 [Parelaphostrongylus tenuis]|uniref:Uncharacterized protein n=1 Tax=Parelaphostrongylus tenuis TaxID=148309 RepID=A0AAD5R245_PARTN|nr:hypothetical protein KIN20_029287 [Parelaphostrongylus tenuis]